MTLFFVIHNESLYFHILPGLRPTAMAGGAWDAGSVLLMGSRGVLRWGVELAISPGKPAAVPSWGPVIAGKPIPPQPWAPVDPGKPAPLTPWGLIVPGDPIHGDHPRISRNMTPSQVQSPQT